MKKAIFSFALLTAVLFAKEKEFFFEGLSGQPLELVSFFIPSQPTIVSLNAYANEKLEWIQRWPGAAFFFSAAKSADLLRLRLNEANPLEGLTPELISSCKAIYLDAFVFPHPANSPSFQKVKQFLRSEGFFPLTFCMREGAQAGLIFVKTDCLYNQKAAAYLETHSIGESYHYYQQKYFPICYCLDTDESDSVKQVLMTGNAYEGNISLMVQALAKPNTVAIDIGAHIGVHTIFMSRKVGKEGAVLSFEPNRKLYLEHRHNLEINDCCNVIPICKGLGEAHKKETLCRITIEQDDPVEGDLEEIEVIPLDSLSLSNVSLIKMDVENYEYLVLKGAQNTILRNKPAIVFECWIGYEYEKKDEARQRENFGRVMALLDSYGYDVYIIYNCDFLAIPRGTTDEILLSYKEKLKRLDPATYQGEPESIEDGV